MDLGGKDNNMEKAFQRLARGIKMILDAMKIKPTRRTPLSRSRETAFTLERRCFRSLSLTRTQRSCKSPLTVTWDWRSR